MAASESARARAPRGAKAVVSAFMAALDDIPEARRMEVAKAAQTTIRDEVKSLAAKAKEAARKSPAPKKMARKEAPVSKKSDATPARAKRNGAAAVAA